MPNHDPMTDLTAWMAEVNHHLASGPAGMSGAARRHLDGYVERIRAATAPHHEAAPQEALVEDASANDVTGDDPGDLYSGVSNMRQPDDGATPAASTAKPTKTKD